MRLLLATTSVRDLAEEDERTEVPSFLQPVALSLTRLQQRAEIRREREDAAVPVLGRVRVEPHLASRHVHLPPLQR